jgi:hypothetical protein
VLSVPIALTPRKIAGNGATLELSNIAFPCRSAPVPLPAAPGVVSTETLLAAAFWRLSARPVPEPAPSRTVKFRTTLPGPPAVRESAVELATALPCTIVEPRPEPVMSSSSASEYEKPCTVGAT